MSHNPVTAPSHYTVYPVQPIEITRHLGFNLGNAIKYVLRAPYKGGSEDVRKALQYLEWELTTPQPLIGHAVFVEYGLEENFDRLITWLETRDGSEEEIAISGLQSHFLRHVYEYLSAPIRSPARQAVRLMTHDAMRMLPILGNREARQALDRMKADGTLKTATRANIETEPVPGQGDPLQSAGAIS